MLPPPPIFQLKSWLHCNHYLLLPALEICMQICMQGFHLPLKVVDIAAQGKKLRNGRNPILSLTWCGDVACRAGAGDRGILGDWGAEPGLPNLEPGEPARRQQAGRRYSTSIVLLMYCINHVHHCCITALKIRARNTIRAVSCRWSCLIKSNGSNSCVRPGASEISFKTGVVNRRYSCKPL